MKALPPVLAFILAVNAAAAERTKSDSSPAGLPKDVVVARITRDIAKNQAEASLQKCFPEDAPARIFSELTNLGWREKFDEFSLALVEKARSQNLEYAALQKALEIILQKEAMAVVPVAAYRAMIGGRDVWIIHLQWEWKTPLKMTKTSNGLKMDERSILGLGHIRTYAITLDSFETIAFESCK